MLAQREDVVIPDPRIEHLDQRGLGRRTLGTEQPDDSISIGLLPLGIMSKQSLADEDEAQHEAECLPILPLVLRHPLKDVQQDLVIHEDLLLLPMLGHPGLPETEEPLGAFAGLPGLQGEVDSLENGLLVITEGGDT